MNGMVWLLCRLVSSRSSDVQAVLLHSQALGAQVGSVNRQSGRLGGRREGADGEG